MAVSTSAANVCVLLPPVIDVQSFSLWLSGLSPQVAAERIIKIDFGDQFQSVDSETAQLYKEETVDRFRTYALLESSLKTPRLLSRNRHIPSSTFFEAQKIDLVSEYYSFDSRVFRHFLGRKLTNKFQKDLDDVRDEVGVPLRSVRRQFGNLRRIFDFYDDVGDSVMVTTQTLLEIEFLLPEHLSRAYSCALFLLVHRFQLQISKKKYQLLTWEDCCFVAQQIMLHWLQRPAFNATPAAIKAELNDSTSMSPTNARESDGADETTAHPLTPRIFRHANSMTPEGSKEQTNDAKFVDGRARQHSMANDGMSPMGKRLSQRAIDDTQIELIDSSKRGNIRNRRGALDLDGHFLSCLRDLKAHIFVGTNSRNDTDAFARVVLYKPDGKMYTWGRRFMSKFRAFTKSLMQIALGLNTQKEFRDLFEDLLDDICTPLNQCKIGNTEVKELFESLLDSLSKLKSVKKIVPVARREQLIESWKKYIFVMGMATVRCMGSSLNA